VSNETKDRSIEAELLEALETIANTLANPVRPGHVAYISKADLIRIANRVIAKARGAA
jgi:hypothetical protein